MSKELMDRIESILNEGVKTKKTVKKKVVKEDEDVINDIPADDTEMEFSGDDEGLEGDEEDVEPTFAEKVAAFESELTDEMKEGVLNYIQNVIEAAKEEDGETDDLDAPTGDEDEEIEVTDTDDETY